MTRQGTTWPGELAAMVHRGKSGSYPYETIPTPPPAIDSNPEPYIDPLSMILLQLLPHMRTFSGKAVSAYSLLSAAYLQRQRHGHPNHATPQCAIPQKEEDFSWTQR